MKTTKTTAAAVDARAICEVDGVLILDFCDHTAACDCPDCYDARGCRCTQMTRTQAAQFFTTPEAARIDVLTAQIDGLEATIVRLQAWEGEPTDMLEDLLAERRAELAAVTQAVALAYGLAVRS